MMTPREVKAAIKALNKIHESIKQVTDNIDYEEGLHKRWNINKTLDLLATARMATEEARQYLEN